jgi:pyruvate formate lyase activating enzyme
MMLISGIQKLTLLDYPEKTACTIFTHGCNFLCPFCHNASLAVRAGELPNIDQEEVFSLLRKRKGILDGVCVSGGEPTLYPKLSDFLGRIKEMGYLVKLDTNGSMPNVIADAISEGLVDYVAMDIKNSKESYSKTVGLENYDISPIIESAELLMRCGIDYEFRTTLVRELHKESDIISIGKWLAGAERYFLQTFIDSGDLLAEGFSSYDKNETEHLLSLLKEYIPNAQIRG